MTIKVLRPLPKTVDTVRDWLSDGLHRYAFSPRPLNSYFKDVDDDLSRRPLEQIDILAKSGKLPQNALREATRLLLSGVDRGTGLAGAIVGQLARIAANLGDRELPRRLRPHLINGDLMPKNDQIKAAPALFTAVEALFKLLPELPRSARHSAAHEGEQSC
jgi:hypothetical protein